jgi:CRP-like cAMP-binding protein
MEHVCLDAGVPAIVQGESGDVCYLLLSGRVEVRINVVTKDDTAESSAVGHNDCNGAEQPQLSAASSMCAAELESKYGPSVGHMQPGESFGEKALEGAHIRMASVIAVEPTELIAVRRANFHDCLNRHRKGCEAGMLLSECGRLKKFRQLLTNLAVLPLY